LILLDPAIVGPVLGWRLAFAFGAVLSVAILLVRRYVPESPRWLITRGHTERAEAEVTLIEAEVSRQHGPLPALNPATSFVTLRVRAPFAMREILSLLLTRYRRRAILGFALMSAQAFFYNAIFFTYGLVLTRFYGVADERVGLYIFPFALGNVLGPLLLGRLFDSVGRRVMITLTYAISGLGLLITGYAFMQGWLTAGTQTACWSVIFFFASAAASSAYLTVSEIFPLEMRAIGISIFFAIGTGAGGFIAPALFGTLIGTDSRDAVFYGYAFAAALMIVAALVAAKLGVDAERKSLEDIAPPLSTLNANPS